ncbi:hypothetical protein BASA81_002867 [Batrachochytrium salamandrivorans]|nr:hypothetical protein BASA81_002867 [Batrachochytrium salamandrivorans]
MPSTTDTLAINTIRALAADVVQKANSGHPGAPMGCAPMAHVLFSHFIRQDPQHPHWISRDRFVLSNGHGCVLQYIMLHMLGYNLSMDDLKQFRQLNSKTPGHPEANHGVNGIEVSTGPLGQGIANAVGLALAEAHLSATFNKPGFDVIKNYTYAIMGDGCLQEGVQAEAVSLAGHLKLGNLIVLYDDNHITIDGDTAVGFTEDVVQRFESYGWHTQVLADGDNDVSGIIAAIQKAKSVLDKPSLIKIRTTIGFGSVIQGEEKVHGAPLGAKDISQLKTKFGFDPESHFNVSAEVSSFWYTNTIMRLLPRGATAYGVWEKLVEAYTVAHPELAKELKRRISGDLPTGWKDLLPSILPQTRLLTTRKLSENFLNKIAVAIPELVGGSADLTGSNLTRWKGAVDFQPDVTGLGTYAGRYVRFGVREHGMAAICNGMHAYGGIIPFGATFFNFISYALGATSGAYVAALENRQRPSVLIFTRQNLPHLEGSTIEKPSREHVLSDPADAKITLVGSGSEVSLAVDTAALLAKEGVLARVVSMPSWELFEDQSHEYRCSVFPDGIPTLSMEAMSTMGWGKYAHASVGIDTFGASAPYMLLYKKFGLVPDVVAEKAKKVVEYYKTRTPETHAPVSKTLLLVVIINSLVASISDTRSRFHLQLFPHLFPQNQFWRLISCHFVFSSSAEILFGSFLIYQFRLLERHWGSPKFAAFFTLCSLISTGVSVVLLLMLRSTGIQRVSPGPFGFISASTVLYFFQVPASYYLKIFGISWSDNVFVYAMSIQLYIASFPHSSLSWKQLYVYCCYPPADQRRILREQSMQQHGHMTHVMTSTTSTDTSSTANASMGNGESTLAGAARDPQVADTLHTAVTDESLVGVGGRYGALVANKLLLRFLIVKTMWI